MCVHTSNFICSAFLRAVRIRKEKDNYLCSKLHSVMFEEARKTGICPSGVAMSVDFQKRDMVKGNLWSICAHKQKLFHVVRKV